MKQTVTKRRNYLKSLHDYFKDVSIMDMFDFDQIVTEGNARKLVLDPLDIDLIDALERDWPSDPPRTPAAGP